MNAPAAPPLVSANWVSPRLRSDGRIVVDAKYAVHGRHVFKRVDGPFGFCYMRAPIAEVFLKTYWTDIPDDMWEPCDVFGFPLPKAR